MNIIRFWWKNSRPTALPQSVMPSFLAICLASSMQDFSIWLSILAIFGVIMAHSGLNLFDDYFDYRKTKSTYREALVHEGFRARIGKCTYLTSGEATTRQLFIAASIFCSIAVILGGIILYYRGITILYIALITAVLGFFYSAPPFRLSYHGLGELLIGLIFGPMNMIGTYYAACGIISPAIIFISVPVGLLVMNIVYVHSILDFIPDKKVGKQTMAVLLNNTTAMLIVLFLIIFLPFIIITFGVIFKYIPLYYLFTYLSLPMAISLFYLMVEYIKHPERKFSPRFWMGPMPNWQRLEEFGIGWFMIRWLSARNLLTFFCLIIIILSFVMHFV